MIRELKRSFLADIEKVLNQLNNGYNVNLEPIVDRIYYINSLTFCGNSSEIAIVEPVICPPFTEAPILTNCNYVSALASFVRYGGNTNPTIQPTIFPTLFPTVTPTILPTVTPTITVPPTVFPTITPTITLPPTVAPTIPGGTTLTPTAVPTTITPTITIPPTVAPTVTPTTGPIPTLPPTLPPTTLTPTAGPTITPTLPLQIHLAFGLLSNGVNKNVNGYYSLNNGVTWDLYKSSMGTATVNYAIVAGYGPVINPGATIYLAITDTSGVDIQFGVGQNSGNFISCFGKSNPYIVNNLQPNSSDNFVGYFNIPYTTLTPPIISQYGFLYNTRIVDEPNFAPTNWRVPTVFDAGGVSGDWLLLQSYLTAQGHGSNFAGVLKSTRTAPTAEPRWTAPNTGASDLYGFTCLPGGYRAYNGTYASMDTNGSLLITGYAGSSPFGRVYGDLSFTYNTGTWQLSMGPSPINSGYSVRFIMIDSSGWNPGSTVTDPDGNVYQTIKIGTQVWLASNWKSTKYTNGSSIPLLQDTSKWAAATTAAMCYYV